MAQILSEIRLFAFDYAPLGWQPCNGQFLPINQHQDLFSLIGTTFGGNGTQNFALPDLRGKILLGEGNGYNLGQTGGETQHTLTIAEMASHTHKAIASSNAANTPTPANAFWAADTGYEPGTQHNTTLLPNAAGVTGGNQPHENMAPFLTMNYCIATTGIFPAGDGGIDDVGTIKPYALVDANNITNRGYWLVCDGRQLPTSTFAALFATIGTTYGGNINKGFFNLPDLRGVATVNWGQGNQGLTTYGLGNTGGAAEVALNQQQLPAHNHTPNAQTTGNVPNANNKAVWANTERRPPINFFATDKGTGPAMNTGALTYTGQNTAHNNLMPFMVSNFMICARPQ